MAVPFRIFQGDTSPSYPWPAAVGGKAVDLTGATATFSMRPISSSTPRINAAVAVVNSPGTSGILQYDWSTGDTNTAGEYVGWFTITLSGGAVQSTPEAPIAVVAHGPSSTIDLCTVDDVREYLQRPASDIGQDPLVASLITSTSRIIMGYIEREITPLSVTATKTFRWNPRYPKLALAPWVLQSSTSVVVDPESTQPKTIASGYGGYSLTPFDQALSAEFPSTPIYDGVWLSPPATQAAPLTLLYFGFREVQITGTWGFPQIPADIRQATYTAVAMVLRREVSALTTTFNIDEGHLERPEILPSAVKSILSRWRGGGGGYF